MTVYDSLHHRPANAELPRESGEAFSNLSSLPPSFGVSTTPTTYLISLRARQLRVRAALLIHKLRNRLHMSRVNAPGVPAEMVNLEARGNLPDELLVEVPMSGGKSLAVSIPEGSVTLRVFRSTERPALRGKTEILYDVSIGQRDGFTAVNPAVMAVNKTPRISLAMTINRRGVKARVASAAALTEAHIPTLTRALEAMSQGGSA